jgi:Prenyltransferase and squalene oxidase repeat
MARTLPAIVAALLLAAGCSRPAPTPPTEPPPVVVAPPAVDPPDDDSIPPPRPVPSRLPSQALALGVDYLLAQQTPDGSWRSDVYATFKDGTALTPLVVTALQDAHDAGVRNPAVEAAIKKGVAWLAKFAKPDGTIDSGPDGFDYPVYTAALSVKALSHPTGQEYVKARDAWLKYLKERQLTEKLGWKPEEKQYGGWGYCRVVPKKPEPNAFAPPLIESNLSATVFALDALKAAGALDKDTAQTAAVFVRRCQNFHPSAIVLSHLPPPEHDGGFHFIYDDPVRNKAGLLDQQPATPPRFHSYGSTSADGFRCLLLCGETEAFRVDWARAWLVRHFRADTHPGIYVKAHEPNREAVYYYYAASAARAFRDHKLTYSGRDWAAELSTELARRQYKDGSWANPVELVRENEPLVATSNAVSALAKCIK